MAVRIRLTRLGAKKKPYYRLVAANSESPRDGKFLEILGSYDPTKNPVPDRRVESPGCNNPTNDHCGLEKGRVA